MVIITWVIVFTTNNHYDAKDYPNTHYCELKNIICNELALDHIYEHGEKADNKTGFNTYLAGNTTLLIILR